MSKDQQHNQHQCLCPNTHFPNCLCNACLSRVSPEYCLCIPVYPPTKFVPLTLAGYTLTAETPTGSGHGHRYVLPSDDGHVPLQKVILWCPLPSLGRPERWCPGILSDHRTENLRLQTDRPPPNLPLMRYRQFTAPCDRLHSLKSTRPSSSGPSETRCTPMRS